MISIVNRGESSVSLRGVGIPMGSPSTEVTKIQSEEPGAGKLHAGICAGGAPKGAFLPR
jgi:hypothetical protein